MIGLRSTRNQPFCWQEKKVLRLLRKSFTGAELQKYRNLYLTITEMDSDFNNQEIKFYTKTISTYSGLSKDWIPKGLQNFERLGILKMHQEKEKGKFKGKTISFTPERLEEIPLKTVHGKSINGKSINGKSESSEDITSLEDIKNKENIYTQDFEGFWKAYPQKKNKMAAFNMWNKTIKEIEILEITQAAKNYNSSVEGKEEKYILHGSTFLNPKERRFEDYLSGNYKEPKKVQPSGVMRGMDWAEMTRRELANEN